MSWPHMLILNMKVYFSVKSYSITNYNNFFTNHTVIYLTYKVVAYCRAISQLYMYTMTEWPP